MTLQQELAHYKKALHHFRVARVIGIGFLGIYPFHAGDGFCRYFKKQQSVRFDELPTLWEMYMADGRKSVSAWWFRYDNLKDRVRVLKEAITIVENKIMLYPNF